MYELDFSVALSVIIHSYNIHTYTTVHLHIYTKHYILLCPSLKIITSNIIQYQSINFNCCLTQIHNQRILLKQVLHNYCRINKFVVFLMRLTPLLIRHTLNPILYSLLNTKLTSSFTFYIFYKQNQQGPSSPRCSSYKLLRHLQLKIFKCPDG